VSLLQLINECYSCQTALKRMWWSVTDYSLSSVLLKAIQTLEHYVSELSSLNGATGGVFGESVITSQRWAVNASEESSEIAEACKVHLNSLLETYSDFLSEKHSSLIHQRLRQQYLEVKDLRLVVLNLLDVSFPLYRQERNAVYQVPLAH
jgi:hypothetical protein